ncbi:hypothetical protein [Actinomycetospora termitidis]|uniref:Uncharacterized protein n=1 Tax=Actinomycetospora termitidis TaxID=3053470 RepID=A0ABT7MIL3_9PSEU|nr:hypothetical protein [Actinomycetospora sp. Odt1-22]MDL5160504.1 hypothetical protein [Actinomycetospora sp. Odt1-22]
MTNTPTIRPTITVPQAATPTPDGRVREITRDQYDREYAHGYAGPVTDLTATTAAGWPTPFWSLVLTPAGCALVPTRLLDLPDEQDDLPEQAGHHAATGVGVHVRAEFDLDALAEPTSMIPGTCQPVADLGVVALGVDVAGTLRPYRLSRRHRARAQALSILTGVPHTVWGGSAAEPGRACAGLGVVRLDRADHDLDMWFDLDGAEHHPSNPAASVIAASFGVHGGIYGPVVFTGAPDAYGLTRDLAAAATVLIAATTAACDNPGDPGAPARRAAEFTALGITITALDGEPDPAGPAAAALPVPAPRAAGESYDAQRHTVCRDGGFPCCAECGEHAPHGHDEHHPDQLTAALAAAR